MNFLYLFSLLCIIGVLLLVYATEKKNTFILFAAILLFAIAFLVSIRLLTLPVKHEIVSVDMFIETGGELFYKGKKVHIEKDIPPLFIMRCKSAIVVTKEIGEYKIYIKDNL